MARYIDANILKEKILEERDKIPLKRVERYSFGVETPYRDGQAMRGGIRKALRCLEQTPTADVAPKSEVDLYRKQVDELEDELASIYDKLEKAKAEVAREIFEEIEDLLKIVKIPCINAEGCITPMRAGYWAIDTNDYAELKKKYTGEQI